MHDAAALLHTGHAMHELLIMASAILGALGQGHEVPKAAPLVPECLNELGVVPVTTTPQGRRSRLALLRGLPGMDGHAREVF